MPDIERIKQFATKNDRTPPEVFVGRETELGFVSDVIQRTQQGAVWGNSVLVNGAPGAGKTSLLHHIQMETLRQCTLDDGCE